MLPPRRAPHVNHDPFLVNRSFFPTYQMQTATNSAQTLSTMATKGVEGLSKTLYNVQQVLRIVQSAAPMVQQYGPMVKNLPMMYRMLKAFKELEDEDEDESADLLEDSVDDERGEGELPEKVTEEPLSPKSTNANDGQSRPKLFI